jgi:membrane dipeptidase
MADQGKRIFDLHCDTIDRLCMPASSWSFTAGSADVPASHLQDLAENDAHVSLERMEGAQWCQCFAIFMPDEFRGQRACAFFDHAYACFEEQMVRHADRIVPVRTAADIDAAFSSGRQAAMLTVEGGSVLAGDLDRIGLLVERCVRIVTITWNGSNELGSGHATRNGLTDLGRKAIPALEEAGILVDVSHLNDEGFWEVEELAQRPFVATHSNLRAVCDHQRNLTDDQFRAIAERGGLVGINFSSKFLADGLSNPKPDYLLRHVDHALSLGGEHVLALGSDYDGTEIPTWLCPCDKMLDLRDLLVREFGEEVAEQVCFQNAHDFLSRWGG